MTAPARLPAQAIDWPIVWEGVELIARAEACRLVAYRCPAGVWTCGWGETDGVGPSTRWSQAHADLRLADSLRHFTHEVLALCRVDPGSHELAAMVSLAYNIGLGAFAKSSVLRAHNRGDRPAAARAFALWNKARVRGVLTVLPGLSSRRAAESALYLRPVDDLQVEPMVQAVAPESALAGSPIAGAGAVTGGAGVLTLLSDAREAAEPVQGLVATARGILVDQLGVQPMVALGVLLLAAGAVGIYWRYRQRADGWA